MKYIKEKPLTPMQQLYGLKRYFPQGKGSVKMNRLRWECTIKPTPVSREYIARIIYTQRSNPTSFIIKPSLSELAGTRVIPHLYSQRQQKLCLFRPKYKEWRPIEQIATTIIPWIFAWLLYFEEWLVSNEWKGGGEHPPRND